MPRSLSGDSLNALLSQETAEAFLVLLDITDENDVVTRLTSDSLPTYTDHTTLPITTTWDQLTEDPQGHWANAGVETWHYGRGGTASSAAVISADVTGDIVDGSAHTARFNITSTVGNIGIRIRLGDGATQIVAGDGGYNLPVIADFTGSNTIWIESTGGLDAASCTVEFLGIDTAHTYNSFPFDITLPKNIEGQISTAQLSIDNVSRQFIDEIRSQVKPLQVNIKVVLSLNPNDIMAEFTDFVLRQVTYDASAISGQLTLEDFMAEMVGVLMTGRNFPGLFFT